MLYAPSILTGHTSKASEGYYAMAAQVAQAEKRVLVVDDDPTIRDALHMILEAEGYHVETAANGAEALSCLREGQPPCLIVLDLMMPVLNGWQFRNLQRQDPALSEI